MTVRKQDFFDVEVTFFVFVTQVFQRFGAFLAVSIGDAIARHLVEPAAEAFNFVQIAEAAELHPNILEYVLGLFLGTYASTDEAKQAASVVADGGEDGGFFAHVLILTKPKIKINSNSNAIQEPHERKQGSKTKNLTTMEKKRVLLVGLEENEAQHIRQNIDHLVLIADTLPKAKLVNGELWVESRTVMDKYLKVDLVIYHGIFDHDFDFITLLALWNGPCLPNAVGMMDCRLRHSGLVRALQVSNFGNAPRGMSIKPENWVAENDTVAKWGNWHCGDNKHRFTGAWQTEEPTIFEPFIVGEAVRIMLVGAAAWQIKLEGEDWLKSIHDPGAKAMPIDDELLVDTQNLAKHFQLEVIGVDYMVSTSGEKYLLEVNHIPNVTIFPFINNAYLKYAVEWCNKR